VLADISRMKSPRNTKVGRKIAHLTGNNAHQFQGQKVKVTRPINAETESVTYELQSGGIPCRPHPAAATQFVSS